MKKQFDRDSLKGWLLNITGIALLSVTFVQDVDSLRVNISNPKTLAEIIDNPLMKFPDGQYLVEYKVLDNKSDDVLPRKKTIWAMGVEAVTARGHRKLGDLSQLFKTLEGCQYCVTHSELNPGYSTIGVLVEQPDSPIELAELIEKLKKVTLFHAIEDDSGFIHLGNSSISRLSLA